MRNDARHRKADRERPVVQRYPGRSDDQRLCGTGWKPGTYGMEVLVTGGNVRCSSISGRSQDQWLRCSPLLTSAIELHGLARPAASCKTFGTAFKFERGCQSWQPSREETRAAPTCSLARKSLRFSYCPLEVLIRRSSAHLVQDFWAQPIAAASVVSRAPCSHPARLDS
jgi:hypothetical protein